MGSSQVNDVASDRIERVPVKRSTTLEAARSYTESKIDALQSVDELNEISVHRHVRAERGEGRGRSGSGWALSTGERNRAWADSDR